MMEDYDHDLQEALFLSSITQEEDRRRRRRRGDKADNPILIGPFKKNPSNLYPFYNPHRNGKTGQSSNSNQTIFCQICLETKNPDETFKNDHCSHAFCTDCIRSHIAAKIEDNVTAVRCPDLNCEGEIQMESCGLILPPELLAMWGRLLCESEFLGSTKFYCPFKDCSAPLLVDGADGGEESVIMESECPHCHRLFCARCKVPWHSEIGCEEFQKLRVNDREREDIMLVKLAEKQKWQRCPNCGQVVEKIHGCLMVICRCRHCFCYKCGGKMDAKDPRHYCSNCKSTW